MVGEAVQRAWIAFSLQALVVSLYSAHGQTPGPTVLRVGTLVAEMGGDAVAPITLFRGEAAAAAPQAIIAHLRYDPNVLEPVVVRDDGPAQARTETSRVCSEWYLDTTVSAYVAAAGDLVIRVDGGAAASGGAPYLTTYDDQREGGVPTDRLNPFPLGSVTFHVIGGTGAFSALSWQQLEMTTELDGQLTPVPGATAEDGSVTVIRAAGATAPAAFDPDNVVRVADAVAKLGGVVEVPLWLTRGADAYESPARVTGRILYDPLVLRPRPGEAAVSQSYLLHEWYGKNIAASTDRPGEIEFSVDGDNDYEITTRDDQRPDGRTEDERNPLLMGLLRFDVIGQLRERTVLEPAGLSLLTPGNRVLRNAVARNGTVVVGTGDADRDGMSDDFERTHGLNPMDPLDAALDPDDDSRNNVEEFREGTNPRQFDHLTVRSLYVSNVEGDDFAGFGTEERPLATIAEAIRQASAMARPERRIAVRIGPGVYEEHVSFQPHVVLEGAGPEVTILRHYDPLEPQQAVVEGAENAAIRNCTVSLPSNVPPNMPMALMLAEGVAMHAQNVVFDGRGHPRSRGIELRGPASSGSTIRDCTIRGVETGVEAVDSGVTLARNLFIDIAGVGVLTRPGTRKNGDISIAPLLGDASLLTSTGFNQFENVSGALVQNENPQEVKAEQNLWGANEAQQIESLLSGDVDFDPWVGKSLIPGSIVALAVNESTNKNLAETHSVDMRLNNSLTVPPGPDGLFVFAGLASGNYAVSAACPGFTGDNRSVAVDGGGVAMALMRLLPTGETPSNVVTNYDVDGNGTLDAIDVQLVVNAALGLTTLPACDVDRSGTVDAIDVQAVINAMLSLQ